MCGWLNLCFFPSLPFLGPSEEKEWCCRVWWPQWRVLVVVVVGGGGGGGTSSGGASSRGGWCWVLLRPLSTVVAS